MKKTIKEFDECLEIAKKSSSQSKPSILLGNGFSMELNKSIFSYSALQKVAIESLEGTDKEKLEELFKNANTQDFEIILKKIRDAIEITKIICASDSSTLRSLEKTYEMVKQCLIKTISKCHPDKPNDIDDWRYDSCQRFIANFDTIYTINYDLTLYWALMHNYDKENSDNNFIKHYPDGFTNPSTTEDYVIWDIKRGKSPSLIYLHGALHIFDDDGIIKKFTWNRSGRSLKSQITDQLERNTFPIFISEGTTSDKKARINGSSILSKGYRSLSNKGGNLFTFGISFSDNDDHLLEAIFNSHVKNLFIGVYGGNIDTNLSNKIQRSVSQLQAPGKTPPQIHYYNTCTAKAWG
ncbi:conserved hypothetical protein [Dethiosulfovibrio peptidovorans DSM 11002]|uniref:DUF4917 domain-containing protein n=1 Tax=Dethiosulfovibrio peptidovorans DSM 11002 TaxID=469381 RepID=D2Z3V5_9BACT|nr:DUF4917 family protein [Dethiosulfovibrio peptidovorans]EFC90411.1 conserved hypothetical protein [Dethiosulfovibrio peptidovorans DSM 11002]